MADKTWFQDFVDKEMDRVYKSGSHVGNLILSAPISGCASVAWPRPSLRKKLDRQRFVEAWVRLSPQDLGADRISVPLLIAALQRSGDAKAARRLLTTHDALALHPWVSVRFVAGKEFDLPSAAVKAIVPELEEARIRRYSYGSVYYAEVRSGLFHEYVIGRDVRVMGGMAEPGYTSVPDVDDPADLAKPGIKARHQLEFPLPWMEKLARGIANSVEPLVGTRPRVILPYPGTWWAEGG